MLNPDRFYYAHMGHYLSQWSVGISGWQKSWRQPCWIPKKIHRTRQNDPLQDVAREIFKTSLPAVLSHVWFHFSPRIMLDKWHTIEVEQSWTNSFSVQKSSSESLWLTPQSQQKHPEFQMKQIFQQCWNKTPRNSNEWWSKGVKSRFSSFPVFPPLSNRVQPISALRSPGVCHCWRWSGWSCSWTAARNPMTCPSSNFLRAMSVAWYDS